MEVNVSGKRMHTGNAVRIHEKKKKKLITNSRPKRSRTDNSDVPSGLPKDSDVSVSDVSSPPNVLDIGSPSFSGPPSSDVGDELLEMMKGAGEDQSIPQDFEEEEDEEFDYVNQMQSLDISSQLGAGTVLALFLKYAGNDPFSIAQRIVSDATYAKGLVTVLNKVATAENKTCSRQDYNSQPAISTSSKAVAMISDKRIVKHMSTFEIVTNSCEKLSWNYNSRILKSGDKEVIKFGTGPFSNTIVSTTLLQEYFSSGIEVYPDAPRLFYWACYNGSWSIIDNYLNYSLTPLPIADSFDKQLIMQRKAQGRALGITAKLSKAREVLAKAVSSAHIQCIDLFVARQDFIKYCSSIPGIDNLFKLYDQYYDDWIKPINALDYKPLIDSIATGLDGFIVSNKQYRKHLADVASGTTKIIITPEFDHVHLVVNHIPRSLRSNYALKAVTGDANAEWTRDGRYRDVVGKELPTSLTNVAWLRMMWVNPIDLSALPTFRVLSISYEQAHSKIIYLKIGSEGGYNFSTAMMACALRIFRGELTYMSCLLSGIIKYSPLIDVPLSYKPIGGKELVGTRTIDYDFDAVKDIKFS